MPECRFCLLDGETDDRENRLFSPCKCKGSAEFIHELCLEKWRTTDIRTNQDSICPICNSIYDSNLIILKETIPDFSNNLFIKIVTNNLFFFTPSILNLVTVCSITTYRELNVEDCNYYANITNYICAFRKPFIVYNYDYYTFLQLFITVLYASLFLNLFKQVHSKRRYLRHSLQVVVVPIAHITTLCVLSNQVILAGSLNQFYLPLYFSLHVFILKSMNARL